MTSVITGANGHLGGNLVRALLPDETVRAVIHRNVDALEGLPIETVQGSVADQASLRKAFRGADTVYHLAAKISIKGDPDGSVHATNVAGVHNAAQAALDEGVARFVHVSSIHAYDMHQDSVHELAAKAGPRNAAYDRSKAEGEAALRKVIDQGLDATIVNPTGVFGPGDFQPSRMGQVFLDLANRKLPALIRGSFDFVDVRDVVTGMIAARHHGETGANYLLGGHRLSVRDIATLAESATGVRAPRTTLPQWLAYPALPFAALQARMRRETPKFTRESLAALRHSPTVDCSRAREVLGHAPRPPAETVADIYAWFEAHGMWRAP